MTEDQDPTELLGESSPTQALDPDSPPPRGSTGTAGVGYRADSIRIPGYRILELLGAGGMGEVWAAQQERPIQRKVALKVIKLGMDSREIVSRFRHERRALALMSHPCIAAVYDAGTTADGRPYFAMEYVPGEPLITYCDKHRLSIQERLELFLKICDGVQHAHQKGIIHRDIKPSNILVTIQDEKPVPKIVDFGLAKATSQQLTGQTMHTVIGSVVGTIEYMSPEQLEVSGLDVDTRADIYSLGVVLYKLLVGSAPFDKGKLGTTHFEELRRIILEQEPPRPSQRLSRIRAAGSHLARERRQDHATLIRRIRGDLDWITLKALEKDRTRRYQTANALAADIRRHLANEPVVARPPSAIYRTEKFVRRHRVAVAAALLVALALIGGAIGTTAGLLRALSAERRANQEAQAARQVSEFLVELFRVADPNEARGKTITARQILDEGSRRIGRELRQQPTTQARLMNTMGTVYRHLGLYEESRELLEDALELRRDQFGDDSPAVAESLAGLAALDLHEGRYPRAQARAEQALAARQAALPSDSPEVADSLRLLGWILAMQSQHAAAIPLFERAADIRASGADGEGTGLAEADHGIGFSLWQLGDYGPAEEALRRSLATYERILGGDDSRIGGALNDLAALLQDQGKHEAALPLLRRALAIKERIIGPDHPDVASSLNNLALAYDRGGRPAEAEPLLDRALQIVRSTHGEEHPQTALVVANLAWVRYRLGKLQEAETLYRRALELYQSSVGRNHRNVAILLQDWSRLYLDRGQTAEAERLLREAVEVWEATVDPTHRSLLGSLVALAELCAKQDRRGEAESLYRRVLTARESKLGEEHPETRQVREALSLLGRGSGTG